MHSSCRSSVVAARTGAARAFRDRTAARFGTRIAPAKALVRACAAACIVLGVSPRVWMRYWARVMRDTVVRAPGARDCGASLLMLGPSASG